MTTVKGSVVTSGEHLELQQSRDILCRAGGTCNARIETVSCVPFGFLAVNALSSVPLYKLIEKNPIDYILQPLCVTVRI